MKKKLKSDSPLRAATCSRFWVLLLETPGEYMDSKSAIGPFRSHAAAEKWIIDDARGTYADSSPDLRAYNAEEWSEPCAILEERRRVRPVPTATIKVRLVQLSSANTQAQARQALPDAKCLEQPTKP